MKMVQWWKARFKGVTLTEIFIHWAGLMLLSYLSLIFVQLCLSVYHFSEINKARIKFYNECTQTRPHHLAN
jgi:hypothetical protein